MIETYLQLTTKLIHDFVGSFHEINVAEDFESSNNLNQYHIYTDGDKKDLLITINVTKLQPHIQLVNLIYKIDGHDNVDSVLIDWQSIDYKVNLPVDEINLPSDLIKKFNNHVCEKLQEKKIDELFKKGLKSPKSKPIDEMAESKLNIERPPLIDTADSSKNSRLADKPDFEDEYEMKSSFKSPPNMPPNFPSIGDDDLNPGPLRNPSLRGYIDPLDQSRSGGENGMYPSMSHPLFSRTSGDPSVPPGARYDEPMNEDVDFTGASMPRFRRSSGGTGNPGFPGGLGGFSGGGSGFGL